MRAIAVGKGGFADLLSAADAFGDVLASQLEMHPAGIAAISEMDREGALQFIEDTVADSRLVAGRGGNRARRTAISSCGLGTARWRIVATLVLTKVVRRRFPFIKTIFADAGS
jgi:hypothetical protein